MALPKDLTFLRRNQMDQGPSKAFNMGQKSRLTLWKLLSAKRCAEFTERKKPRTEEVGLLERPEGMRPNVRNNRLSPHLRTSMETLRDVHMVRQEPSWLTHVLLHHQGSHSGTIPRTAMVAHTPPPTHTPSCVLWNLKFLNPKGILSLMRAELCIIVVFEANGV